MFTISFYLKPRPPFRLDLTVWALRRLPHNVIDQWNGSIYSRVLVMNSEPVKINVTQPGKQRIRVDVQTGKEAAKTELRAQVTQVIKKMLGVRKDLQAFYALAGRDKRTAPLMTRFLGLKPPQFPSVFEALVNAIACQQLSLHVGIELLNRLAKMYGRDWTSAGETLHAFPLPQDLARATREKLRSIGFSGAKADVIIALSRNINGRKVDIDNTAQMDDSQALHFLLGLQGIGRWSAEYVMLRGLGRIHIFPGDDVGAQNNLKLLFDLKERPDYPKIKRLMLRWHPYAGFLYFHFLLNKLATKGYLEAC